MHPVSQVTLVSRISATSRQAIQVWAAHTSGSTVPHRRCACTRYAAVGQADYNSVYRGVTTLPRPHVSSPFLHDLPPHAENRIEKTCLTTLPSPLEGSSRSLALIQRVPLNAGAVFSGWWALAFSRSASFTQWLDV